MPISKELQAEFEEKALSEKLLAEFEAKAEQEAQVEPVEEDNSNWVDRINAIGQGASFGFADELGTGIAAGIMSMVGDTDESFSDIYSDMMESEKYKREHYAKHNPKEALALEIAGGLTSGGLSGAKVLGTQAVKNIVKDSVLKKAIATSAVGGAEGSVAGFGSGDSFDDRVSKAGTGAAWGAGFGAGGELLAQGLKGLFRRNPKISEMVQPDGSVMPITLAADETSVLGDFYRRIIQDSIGGGELRHQGRPFVEAAEDEVSRRGDLLTEIKRAGDKEITQVLRESSDYLADTGRRTSGRVSEVGKQGSEAVAASARAIKEAGAKKAGELEAAFRDVTEKASYPAKISEKTLKSMEGKRFTDKVQILGEAWEKSGFDVVTKRGTYFDVDPKQIENKVVNLFNNTPALKGRVGEDFAADFRESLDKIYNPKTGQIAGNKLMELRNTYSGRDAPKDDLTRGAYQKIKGKLDEIIEGGLSKSEKLEYQADKDAWGAYKTMSEAAGKAAVSKSGDYTPDEWLSSIAKHARQKNRGAGQEFATRTQERRSDILDAIEEQVRTNPLKAQAEEAKKAAEAVKLEADMVAKNKTRAAEDMARGRETLKVDAAKETVQEAKDVVSKLRSKWSESPSLQKSQVATGTLSTGVTGKFSTLGGAALAKPFTPVMTQRLLAKQYPWQGAVDESLRKLSSDIAGDAGKIQVPFKPQGKPPVFLKDMTISDMLRMQPAALDSVLSRQSEDEQF